MGHGRVAALVAAADQNLSAASTARGQNMRIKQTHMVACGQHATCLLPRPCTHVQRAPQAHCAAVHAAQQHNGALPVFHGLRLHHARVVDRIGQQVARRLGAHEHLAAIGLQQSAIGQQGMGHAFVHAHAQQLISQNVQRHGLTCRHGHAAQRGLYNALVVSLCAQQGHIAAVGCTQNTLIDHCASALPRKTVKALHEIGIAQIQGRCHQTAHIDRSSGSKQDAARVDQKHLAVGREAAQNGRSITTQHPVERN